MEYTTLTQNRLYINRMIFFVIGLVVLFSNFFLVEKCHAEQLLFVRSINTGHTETGKVIEVKYT